MKTLKRYFDQLVLGDSEAERRQWWLKLHSYSSHESKPIIRAERYGSRIDEIVRAGSALWPSLRRYSGLLLPWLADADAQKLIVYTKPGEETATRLPPAPDQAGNVHPTFREFFPKYSSRPSQVYRIPRGIFHGGDQVVMSADYRVIDWLAPFWAQKQGRPATMFRGRLPALQQLKGRVLVLSAPGAGENMWHVLFDALGKLPVLAEAGLELESFSTILVDSRRHAFQRDIYEKFLPGRPLLDSEEGFFQADELVVVSLGYLIPPDRWAIEFLRHSVLPSTPASRSRGRRIFISRNRGQRRRLLEEDTIFPPLQAAGFERIYLEQMSFAEQVQALASAAMVVAPHGAGLSNIIWCQPGTRLFELFAPEYVSVCYWLITEMLGMEYSYRVGERTLNRSFGPRVVCDEERSASHITFPDPAEVVRAILAVSDRAA